MRKYVSDLSKAKKKLKRKQATFEDGAFYYGHIFKYNPEEMWICLPIKARI